MIDFTDLMTPTENIRGGNGVIFVSKNFVVGDTVTSIMIIPPGSSIGLHEHSTEAGETEVYQVLKGDAPKSMVYGRKLQCASLVNHMIW